MAAWQTRLASSAAQTAYGWVAAECTATVAALTAFVTAYNTYHAVDTRSNHDLKEEARKAAIAAMRAFANKNVRYNPKMNTAQREELGIFPHDSQHTPVPAPAAQATANVRILGVHLLALHLSAMPGSPPDPHDSDYGFRIYWGIFPPGGASVEAAIGPRRELMKIPLSGEDLPHSRFTRRKREIFDFAAEDSGKTVFFCVRFENAKGEPGPWGPVFSAVIP
jgi:hypothetical protein